MVASLILGGGARPGLLPDAILQLLAIPASLSLSLEDLRGFFDEADATGVVVLPSNRRPSASSADSAAAMALDGVAEPATISRDV